MINVDKNDNCKDFFNQIREVYSWLEDNISKELFNARLLYNHTKNTEIFTENASQYIKQTLALTNNQTVFNADFNDDELIVIYGAGIRGKKCFDFIKKKANVKFYFVIEIMKIFLNI